jgi:hypothetical protein
MILLRIGIRSGFRQKYYLHNEGNMDLFYKLNYLDPILEILVLISLGLALTAVGYLLKGVWGACIALGIGVVLFLYFKGLLPF